MAEENQGGNSNLQLSGNTYEGEIHCPLCGIGLNGTLEMGKKQRCPSDDCKGEFSLRIFSQGLRG